MATLCFLLWFILNLTLVTGQSVYYVFKSREAILTPAPPKPPDDILWKHNGDKVITFDGADERVFEPYKGRVTLAWDTAQLTITDVRYEDSGEYELYAIISERLYRSQYKLKVLDEVSKPVITCEMNDENSNSNITSATLYCSSSSNTPEALTFIWNLEGKSERGQTLPIALGNEHDDIKYSCTANNHLHKETSSFMAKDCYTERTSESVNIVVPIVITFLILLAFCIFSMIFRHRIKRACSKMGKNDDVEKQLNGAEPKQNESDRKGEGDPLIEYDQKETKSSSQVQRGKGNDIGGKATSASLNSSVQKPAPDPGHMASGGDMDLQQKELNNLTTTEEAGDTHSDDSDEGEDHKALQILEPQSPSSERQDKHKINPAPSEQRSSEQREPEEQPDEHHKDHDDEKKNQEAGSSVSIQTGSNESTKTSEQTGYVKHAIKIFENHENAETFTEPPSSEPQDNHNINPAPSEQRSSEQTEPEEQPDEHHKDHDDVNKMDESTKTSEQTEVPQSSPQSSTAGQGATNGPILTGQVQTDPLSEDPSNHEGSNKQPDQS